MKPVKKILSNGLRVVVAPMSDNPTVTVLVLVETGSKYETKEKSGISHFLEHMCFKGTVRRPKAIDISKELDALGGQYNAFTAQEYTGYYAKSGARHFKKIFDVVTDIYLNSTFPAAEIEREKGVIVEEINMYEDTPVRHVGDLMMRLLYGDTPAGRNIAGDKKSVLRMKQEDLVSYKRAHYLPSATVLAVAGRVNPRDVFSEAERVFGSLPLGRKARKERVREIQKKPEVLVKFKDTDQTHLILAVRSFGIFDKRNPIISVLGGVLGGGMSSRLFQRLREEMGVGYYVRAGADAYTDHGFLEIAAGVDNRRVREVVGAVLEECRRICMDKIGEEEMRKVKEYLIGNMKLSLESSDDIANFYGGQELLKKELKTSKEKARELREVTAGEVRNLARSIFRNDKLNLALIGPFRNASSFRKILKL